MNQNIPAEAIEAATRSIVADHHLITEGDAYDLACNALAAALPSIREQIARDIEAAVDVDAHPGRNVGLRIAARVARGGEA
ncbi:hypothetical protein [Georgenia thermotolerans]|uniref:hypothetical protein n=1 Tax=Georgenia thermotolerans TaxID=527326 RepID=UPI00126554AF|nr:hypothetical protein [Georgenia thermotolerans]